MLAARCQPASDIRVRHHQRLTAIGSKLMSPTIRNEFGLGTVPTTVCGLDTPPNSNATDRQGATSKISPSELYVLMITLDPYLICGGLRDAIVGDLGLFARFFRQIRAS